LIHGDSLSFSIGAASILAKVARDAALLAWDRVFPDYGLARNKGTAPWSTLQRWNAPDPQLCTGSASSPSGMPANTRNGQGIPLSYQQPEQLELAALSVTPKSPEPLPKKSRFTGAVRIACSGSVLPFFLFLRSRWDIFSGLPLDRQLEPELFRGCTGPQDIWDHPYFRGALTGLGFLNVYLAGLQVIRLLKRA